MCLLGIPVVVAFTSAFSEEDGEVVVSAFVHFLHFQQSEHVRSRNDERYGLVLLVDDYWNEEGHRRIGDEILPEPVPSAEQVILAGKRLAERDAGLASLPIREHEILDAVGPRIRSDEFDAQRVEPLLQIAHARFLSETRIVDILHTPIVRDTFRRAPLLA